jgi:hypothetical protein
MDFDFNNLNFINYTFSSINLAISSFKILLNALIFYIIIQKCNIKHPEIILIFILSILESLSGVSLFLISILKLIFGYEYINYGSYSCWITSLTITGNTRCEMITIAVLAVLRYSIVCHNFKRGVLFWLVIYLIVILPIAVIFIYPFIMKDANTAPSFMFCSSYMKPSVLTSALLYIIPLIFLFPCWIVTFCYFEIGRKVYRNLNIMNTEAVSKNDTNLQISIKKQSRKLMIQLAMIFCLFNINFMPSYISWILRLAIDYKRTPIVDAITFELIEISLAIDPIITVTFQPELNHELNILLFKFKLRIKNFIGGLLRLVNIDVW